MLMHEKQCLIPILMNRQSIDLTAYGSDICLGHMSHTIEYDYTRDSIIRPFPYNLVAVGSSANNTRQTIKLK